MNARPNHPGCGRDDSHFDRQPRSGKRVLGATAIFGALVAVGLLTGPLVRATSQDHVWVFEDVVRPDLVQCATEAQVVGFDYDSQGRPVLAWREDDGCGFPNHAFWARLEQGTWARNEIVGPNGGFSHQMALRRSDGAPFALLSAVGPFGATYTYRSNLDVNPNGGNWQQLETLVGAQNCAYSTYSMAFGLTAVTPNWGTGLGLCSGRGPVRLDGETIEQEVAGAATALAIGSDGTRHLLYFGGPTSSFPGGVYYTQGPQTSPEVAWRGRGIPLLTAVTTSSAGADLQIEVDATGVLHAVIRVPDFNGGFGASWYVRSEDNGHSWSVPESMGSSWWQLHTLAVDASGTPAVAYWDGWTQLRYARRDAATGTWPSELITNTFHRASPSPRLTFDPGAGGQPVVAFFDAASRMLKTARPMLATDPALPKADLAVTVSAAPNPAPVNTTQTVGLQVSNQGPRHTTNTVLTVTLPGNVTFVSSSQPPLSQVGQVLTFNSWAVASAGWSSGLLTSGATGSITLTVSTSGTPGPGVLTASVTASEPEATPVDNSASVAIAIAPALCFPPRQSLRAWWPAESALEPIVNVPTMTAGGVSFGAGRVGQAFVLDGSTGWVSASASDDNYLYPRTGPFSVSAWIATSRSTGSQTIVSKYAGANAWGGSSAYFFNVEDGKLSLWMRDAVGGVSQATGSTSVADGAFHHVAMVRDVAANQVRLYVDGVVDAVVSTAGGATGDIGSLSGDRDAFGIGSSGESGSTNRSAFFAGAIDDVAWFSESLATADVAALAAAPYAPGCGNPNQPPVAVDDTATTTESTPVVVDVLANDTDGDGDGLTVSGVTQGANGSVIIGAGALVTYTPFPGFVGLDTFTYAISDGHGGTATATVSVTVKYNHPPTLVNPGPQVTCGPNQTLVQRPLTWSDPDGTAGITFTATGLPKGLFINDLGVITGLTSSRVAAGVHDVSVTISDGLAQDTQTFTWVVDNCQNDYAHGQLTWAQDLEGSTADTVRLDVRLDTAWKRSSPSFDTPPQVGDVLSQHGMALDWSGPGDVDGRQPLTMTVVSVNEAEDWFLARSTYALDLPRVDGDYRLRVMGCCRLDEVSDGNARRLYGLVSTVPIRRGAVPPGSALSSLLPRLHGTVGTLIATQVPLAAPGNATVTTQLTSTHVSGLVTPAPSGLTLTPTGWLSWMPATPGLYALHVTTRTDAGVESSLEFLLDVGRPNAPPVANDDTVNTPAGQAVSIPVLANDVDPDQDLLTIASVTQGHDGSVIVGSAGMITYTPNPGYVGVDTFTYTISDGKGGSDTAQVSVTVTTVNRPPTVNLRSQIVSYEGTPVALQLRASDPDFDPVTLSVQGLPAWVTVTQLSASTVEVSATPPSGSTGVYPFTTTVSDGQVTITQDQSWRVNPPNAPPVANPDVMTGTTGSLSVNVLANDVDPEGQALRLVSATQPSYGRLTTFPDGSVIYLPTRPAPFEDTFTYVVADSVGATAIGQVTITMLVVGPAVEVSVAGEPASIISNQDAVYRVTVRNWGNQASNASTVFVQFPSGLTLLSTTPEPSGSLARSWPLESLAPGARTEIVIRFAPPPLLGDYVLTATALAPDSTPANNVGSGVVKLLPEACFASPWQMLARWPFDLPDPRVEETSGGRRLSLIDPERPSSQPIPVIEAGRRREAIRLNGSVYLDGLGSVYRETSLGPALAYLPQQFTLSAWVRPDSLRQTGFDPVMSQLFSWSPVTYTFWLGFDQGRPSLAVTDAGGTQHVARGETATTVGTWHHLAGTFDGQRVRIYLDGRLAGDIPMGDSLPWGSLSPKIGEGRRPQPRTEGERYGFVGLLDDVAIYERALDASEIRAMNEGPAGSCLPATTTQLNVSAVATPAVTVPTGQVEFTVSVANASNGYVPNVTVTHTLPAGTTFVSADVTPSSTTSTQQTFTIGPMAAGQTADLRIVARAPAVDGRFSARADVSPLDDQPGDNTALAPYDVAPASCFVPTPGLLGEWRFDGTGQDEITGAVGRFPTSAFYSPNARTGKSLNTTMVMDNGAAYRTGSTSMAAWVYPNVWSLSGGGSPGWEMALWNGDAVWLGLSEGYPAVRTSHVDGRTVVTRGSARIRTSQWTLLSASFDGDKVVLYVNGMPVAETAIASAIAWPDAAVPLMFRGRPGSSPEGTDWATLFSGQIDEVRIYDRALTADEMRSMHAGSADCAINEHPVLRNPGPQTSRVDDVVQLDLVALDPDNTRPLTFSASRLPAGLSIDPQTGRITGTVLPAASGENTVTVTVSDGSLDVSETFDWTIPHRVIVHAGLGALVTLDGTPCDGRVTPVTCRWDLPYGPVPVVTTGAVWWGEDGRQQEISNRLQVFRSVTLDLFRLVRYTVAIEGTTEPFSSMLSPALDEIPSPRPSSYLVCRNGMPSPQCFGYAPMGSTVSISGFAGVMTAFERFSGDCVGPWCALAMSRDGLAVTAHYRPRRYPLKLTVGAKGSVLIQNLTTSTESVCAGPTQGYVDVNIWVGRAECDLSFDHGTTVRLVPFVVGRSDGRWGWRPRNWPGRHPVDDTPVTFIAGVDVDAEDRFKPLEMRVTFQTQLAVVLDGHPITNWSNPPLELSGFAEDSWTCDVPSNPGRCVQRITYSEEAGRTWQLASASPTFVGWSGACSGLAPCDIVADVPDVAVTASFRPINTAVGTGVRVTGPGATVTFAGVTSPGVTLFEPITSMDPPDGFKFGSPPVLVDIWTTAQYTAPVTICFSVPRRSFANPAALFIYHYENGAWVNRTSSINPFSGTVCATVSSLSPFAVVAPVGVEGHAAGAGTVVDATGGEHHLELQVQESTLGVERGHLRYTRRATGAKGKADAFVATTLTDVALWSHQPGGLPRAAVSGTGVWNGQPGYTFWLVVEDAGPPSGERDGVRLVITDPGGVAVADIDGRLARGNVVVGLQQPR